MALIENAEDLDIVISMYSLLSIAKIIKRHMVLCGIIIELNQLMRQMMIMVEIKM